MSVAKIHAEKNFRALIDILTLKMIPFCTNISQQQRPCNILFNDNSHMQID